MFWRLSGRLVWSRGCLAVCPWLCVCAGGEEGEGGVCGGGGDGPPGGGGTLGAGLTAPSQHRTRSTCAPPLVWQYAGNAG